MLVLRGLAGGLAQLALLAALLLIPAGRWDWPRAIGFLGAYGLVNAVSIVALARLAPASLEARLMAPSAKSQPQADRIVTPLFIASLFLWLAFIPIDVFRLGWLPRPPLEVSLLLHCRGNSSGPLRGVRSLAGHFTIPATLGISALTSPPGCGIPSWQRQAA